jgi:Clp protease
MQYIKSDVSTICMGQAASFAAFLLLAGAKGKRYALPHARVLLHQPRGGAQGQTSDIEIQAKEFLRYRKLIDDLIAQHTGQPVEKVHSDTDRDYIMTAEQAKDYGVIDEVISTRKAQAALSALLPPRDTLALKSTELQAQPLPTPRSQVRVLPGPSASFIEHARRREGTIRRDRARRMMEPNE